MREDAGMIEMGRCCRIVALLVRRRLQVAGCWSVVFGDVGRQEGVAFGSSR